MHGEGSDASVADQVVEEIERAGGVAVASHDSVASPEGGEAIVRTAVDRFGRLDAVVSNAGIFQHRALREADRRRLAAHAERPPRRRLLPEPAGVPRDEVAGLRPLRLHLVVRGHVREAAGSALRRRQGRARRARRTSSRSKARRTEFSRTRAPVRRTRGWSAETTRPGGGRSGAVGVPAAIEPELVVPIVVFLASRACDVHAIATTRRARVATRASSSDSARDGSPSPAASRPPTTSRPISPRCRRRSPSASRRRSSTR